MLALLFNLGIKSSVQRGLGPFWKAWISVLCCSGSQIRWLQCCLLVIGPGKGFSLTLSLTLFSYHFQSVKSRYGTVQGLSLWNIFVISLFLIYFSAATSQKLSGIARCVWRFTLQESMLTKVLQMCFILIWVFFNLNPPAKIQQNRQTKNPKTAMSPNPWFCLAQVCQKGFHLWLALTIILFSDCTIYCRQKWTSRLKKFESTSDIKG